MTNVAFLVCSAPRQEKEEGYEVILCNYNPATIDS